MSKRGLGRGLSALIPNAIAEEDIEVHEVSINEITPNPKQPRTDMGEESVAELADSIRKVGMLQPIVVRPHGDRYQIIAGERRWIAARAAGLKRVPVRVMSKSEAESLELALIENLQRQDLNAIEEARGYRRLLTEHQMTQAELAEKVSKSRSTVTNALRLLDLPEEVQRLVYEGQLSAGHARTVLSVPDEALRVRLGNRVVTEGLSVRETENLARLYAAGQAEREPRTQTPKSFKIVARKLRKILGTGVRVRQTQKKGKIEIEFHGEDELERIFRLMTEGEASCEDKEVER